jgi:hypothetical protein
MIPAKNRTTLALIVVALSLGSNSAVCSSSNWASFRRTPAPGLGHRWDPLHPQRGQRDADPHHLHLRGGSASRRMPKSEGFLDSSVELAETEGDVEEMLDEERMLLLLPPPHLFTVPRA